MIFDYSNITNSMDSKKLRRKPKLERRNALKYFDYDAGSSSSSSSFDDSSGSLYTRSMELYDRTSFRIEGIEGELDRICQSLGLSGPEDFAIPAAAWEAMKFRSSSDILPSLKIEDIDLQQQKVEEVELSEKCEDMDRDRDSVRVTDEVAETVVVGSGGGGINGIRPPMIKPPPGMRVRVVDNTCSTWDLLKELAPVVEGEEGVFNREMEEKESEEVDKVSPKREEENVVVDNAAMIAEIVDGLSDFSTSNEDDSSSSATEPRSNNVSPNGRIKRVITPGCWQKGEFLGGGSFGSVYEGISE
jgi:mitogen-activated protein kinase kinase kinase 1